MLGAVAALHVRGVSPVWGELVGRGRRVELPAYAFQRERFWLVDEGVSAGLAGVVTRLADSGGVVVSGRLSVGSRPWVADHVVAGRVLLPGTAFVELAVRAGDEVGCGLVEELTLQAPLVVGVGEVELQVVVGAADGSGRRGLSVHSRVGEGEWTRHATGVLADRPASVEPIEAAWPPADAVAIDPEEVRAALADRGYDYGPAWGGLRAVWRRGDEWFGEVVLPEGVSPEGFVVHPALLDTALQPLVLEVSGPARLPFVWERVSVVASGATSVRVWLRPSADGFSVVLA
ncbi:polyketide synthase dehydratase domain-containing protein, partial [Spongiactinospora sp. 9N601]|uniref:polyketide synthase dehydratase domain-containing protein n=1 Tax=Spongiactinospora sp. 9N601 TaxID=3375149 RepID=UPI0037AD08F5